VRCIAVRRGKERWSGQHTGKQGGHQDSERNSKVTKRSGKVIKTFYGSASEPPSLVPVWLLNLPTRFISKEGLSVREGDGIPHAMSSTLPTTHTPTNVFPCPTDHRLRHVRVSTPMKPWCQQGSPFCPRNFQQHPSYHRLNKSLRASDWASHRHKALVPGGVHRRRVARHDFPCSVRDVRVWGLQGQHGVVDHGHAVHVHLFGEVLWWWWWLWSCNPPCLRLRPTGTRRWMDGENDYLKSDGRRRLVGCSCPGKIPWLNNRLFFRDHWASRIVICFRRPGGGERGCS